MEIFALVLPTLITLVGGALGALFWSRLNRIEDRLAWMSVDMATKEDIGQLREELATKAGSEELAGKASSEEVRALRAELATKSTRDDVGQLRGEMTQLRQEVTGLRSDLTYVALAVGAKRPKASEG